MFKDMVKDLAMRLFLIHLAAFVAGVLDLRRGQSLAHPGHALVPLGGARLGRRARHPCLRAFPAQDAAKRAHLHRQEGPELRRSPLRLCGDGADPSLCQSHRHTKSVVVLLGGPRLGRGRRLPRLVHVLQEAAAIAFSCRRAGESGEEPGEEAKNAEASVSALGPQARCLRRSAFTLRSTTSQIMAAMSGPPNCATCLMPVGEVTLISVR